MNVYLDRRMLWVLAIGALSGFPWAIFSSLVTLRMQDAGISKGEIGLFGLVALAYTLNLLWAPLIDAIRLPHPKSLAKLAGRRKSWILVFQLLVLALALVLASLPFSEEFLWWIALVCALMAFAGATQDVAIDALRIELIGPTEGNKAAAAAAMATTGWWLGYSGLGALLVLTTGRLETAGVSDPVQVALYLSAPLGFLIWWVVALWVPEPQQVAAMPRPSEQSTAAPKGVAAAFGVLYRQMLSVYGQPVLLFLRQYGWRLAIGLLVLIFLFKSGEAFLGRMSLVFYRELGLDYQQIGWGKLASTITVVVSSILGGLITVRWGLVRGLLIGGVLMAGTNLLFSELAQRGPDTSFFLFAVVADQVTSAIATVVFVAFISQLCNRAYAATQYAALASLGNLSRTSLAAFSGYLVMELDDDWSVFFIITAVMVLPSLILLMSLSRRLERIFRR
ncbi:MAG: MFS transporter [Gammaproteobacteria bacterium]